MSFCKNLKREKTEIKKKKKKKKILIFDDKRFHERFRFISGNKAAGDKK